MLAPIRATIRPSPTSFLRTLTYQSFSTSRALLDIAKVSLIGRLGSDPIKREASHTTCRLYYVNMSELGLYHSYNVATATGPQKVDSEGKPAGQMTNWHSVFAFSEASHNLLANVGKGSAVYVEADLEMRASEPAGDGSQPPDRPLLRHRYMNVINRVKPPTEEGVEQDE